MCARGAGLLTQGSPPPGLAAAGTRLGVTETSWKGTGRTADAGVGAGAVWCTGAGTTKATAIGADAV